MKAIISKSILNGSISSIASKSILHRAIIMSSLAKGKSIIKHITLSDDILSTISCCKELGAKIEIGDDELIVKGIDISNINKTNDFVLDASSSASTLRFLLPIASILGSVFFKCSKSLLRRPMDTFKDIYGNNFQKCSDGFKVTSSLKANIYEIDASISSQFLTGLLIALPFLNADSEIRIVGEMVSTPYVDLTLDLLSKFGINIERTNNTFKIAGNCQAHACNIEIEGDYSNASYFLALNLVGSSIVVLGLNPNSLQGDKKFIEFMQMIKGPSFMCDLKDCPDLAPILFALASTIPSKSIFTSTKRLETKESNRLYAMKEELSKFGVLMEIKDDSVEIIGKTELECNSFINTHDDHRICMALTILALTSNNSVTINDIECVNKSYPDFFKDLIKLGANIRLI